MLARPSFRTLEPERSHLSTVPSVAGTQCSSRDTQCSWRCQAARTGIVTTAPQHSHTSQPSTSSSNNGSGNGHGGGFGLNNGHGQGNSTATSSRLARELAMLADREYSLGYWELLSSPESQEVFSQRARSASDAAVLRRKGHLKEQDRLIDYMRRMHETHTCEEVMLKMERWLSEHRQDPKRSRLRRLIPGIGSFFTPLKLVEAFREYDAFFALSRRKYIPPNFAELRHIVNIAQVHASADTLKLITFDADGTLYADGCHMEQDNQMIAHIINLMRSNVQVAIVTAAGYPGEPDKFEKRVQGLLEAFRRLKLAPEITNRFHIMGGECNYLLKVTPNDKRMEFVPDHEWKTQAMLSWKEADIVAMLDEAEAMLQEGAKRLNLPVNIIRKNRAVGIVPMAPTIYEVLEDIALTIQTQLVAKVPFCAFNGGNDVFVDVGNKLLGLDALTKYLRVTPPEVLHVGDRFTDSGNDVATRDICSVLWVANPEETGFFIKMLLKDIRKSRWQPYIE